MHAAVFQEQRVRSVGVASSKQRSAGESNVPSVFNNNIAEFAEWCTHGQ